MADPSANIEIFKGFVGFIGNILALLFFIAPISMMKKLYKREQIYDQIPYFLMIMTILNCSLWLSYGMIVKDFFLIIGNAIGAILNMVYLCIYFFFRWEHNKFKFCLISSIVPYLFLTIWGLLTYIIKDGDVSRFSAMFFNILMYGAPGQKIVKYLKI